MIYLSRELIDFFFLLNQLLLINFIKSIGKRTYRYVIKLGIYTYSTLRNYSPQARSINSW